MANVNPDAAAKLAEPAETVRRDNYGRYLILPPNGKKPVGYTRATTIAKVLDDTSSLMAWNSRMTALGLAQRPDLVAMIAATDPADKRALDGIVKRASEAGGATVRRDLGTAIHGMLDNRLNNPDFVAPDPYQSDIDAILQAVADAGLSFLPGMNERIVINDEFQIAGMFDLLLTNGTDIFITDLKTGSSVKYGGLAYSIQLSIYAHADALYTQGSASDGSEDIRESMPDVSKHTGIIIHCEPGSAHATLHWLDLNVGTEALETALNVRRLRRMNPLSEFTPQQAMAAMVGPSRPGKTGMVDDDWRTAVTNRIGVIIDAGHTNQLLQAWPSDCPTLKSGDLITLDQADEIVAALELIEKEHELPFAFVPDQTPLVDPPQAVKRRPRINERQSRTVPQEQVNELNAYAKEHLTEEGLAWVGAVLKNAEDVSQPLTLTRPAGIPTRRRLLICQLLIQIGNHADDDLAWCLLDHATDHTIPHHSLGDAFGSLRQTEAHKGIGIANAIDNLQLIPTWDENGCRLEGDINAAISGNPTPKETK